MVFCVTITPMILTLLVFLIILSVLVLIHELGHFIVARRLGIKVEEFGFGFPPRAFGIKHGETLYSINWLPIGGFVKLYGEDEAGGGRLKVQSSKLKVKAEDEERAFYTKTPWQRAAVVVAGVVMNAVLAIVIFYVYFLISGFKTDLPLVSNYQFFGVEQVNKNVNEKDAVVSYVSANSPAEKAGIVPPAQIIAVNGKPISDRLAFIEFVNGHKGEKIKLTWKYMRTGNTYTAILTPRKNPPPQQGALGIGFFPITFLEYKTPIQQLSSGVVHPINLLSYNFNVMGQLLSVSVKEKNPEAISQGVAGPVGILSLVDSILNIESAKERVLQILNLAGILSISLAFFNILPIPALDGGRLFFILIEAFTGKKINQKLEGKIHTIGMAVLLTLIILITVKDVRQFVLPFFK